MITQECLLEQTRASSFGKTGKMLDNVGVAYLLERGAIRGA
jgi:hypothetical protein